MSYSLVSTFKVQTTKKNGKLLDSQISPPLRHTYTKSQVKLQMLTTEIQIADTHKGRANIQKYAHTDIGMLCSDNSMHNYIITNC